MKLINRLHLFAGAYSCFAVGFCLAYLIAETRIGDVQSAMFSLFFITLNACFVAYNFRIVFRGET